MNVEINSLRDFIKRDGVAFFKRWTSNIQRPMMNQNKYLKIATKSRPIKSFYDFIKRWTSNIEHRTSNVEWKKWLQDIKGRKQEALGVDYLLYSLFRILLFCFFIYTHSKFDVGRSMFDVHWFAYLYIIKKAGLKALLLGSGWEKQAPHRMSKIIESWDTEIITVLTITTYIIYYTFIIK